MTDRDHGTEQDTTEDKAEEKKRPELEKETVRDLDVPAQEATDVKAGDGCFTHFEPHSCC